MGKVKPISYESVLGRSKIEGEEKSYQQRVVDSLLEVTDDLLSAKSDLLKKQNDFLLKAPTGSGKTIITGGYIDTIFLNYEKVVVLWVSETPNLTKQSLDKLRDIFNLQTSFYGEDVNISIENKTVIGINWEKIKNTKAREDTEVTLSIDTLISRAKDDGYTIITVVDEAHSHADSKLSKDFLGIVESDIILNVTATPRRDYSVEIEVDIEDVQRAGFIKQGIVINDLKDNYNNDYREAEKVDNLTEYFLHQSIQKRAEVEDRVAEYTEEKGKKPFVPLLVVQLPNNSNEIMETVENYFERSGYSRDEGNLAVYMSNDYTDELDAIGQDENVKVLLFKQAISKGWDCPRASVITLLREPNKQHFVTQTIGRILRMPYLEMYPTKFDELNYGYVFIEETENKILQSVMEDIRGQDISLTLYRKEGVVTELDDILKQVWVNKNKKISPSLRVKKLTNLVEDRIEYDGWFSYLIESEKEDVVYHKGVHKGRIKVEDLAETEEVGLSEREFEEIELNLSYRDLVEEFNQLCKKHKINLDDVWEILGTNIYPRTKLESEEELLQKILANSTTFVTDINRIYEKLQDDFEERYVKELKEWKIPSQWVVPIDAEITRKDVSEKTPYNEVWLQKNKLEQSFVDYLVENDDVVLWYKNGDRGSKYFSIAYYLDGKYSHFYPDFLVETESTLYILETKGVLDGEENIEKVKSMKEYAITYMSERDREIQAKQVVLGYVKEVNGVFYVYQGNSYKEDINVLRGWKELTFK